MPPTTLENLFALEYELDYKDVEWRAKHIMSSLARLYRCFRGELAVFRGDKHVQIDEVLLLSRSVGVSAFDVAPNNPTMYWIPAFQAMFQALVRRTVSLHAIDSRLHQCWAHETQYYARRASAPERDFMDLVALNLHEWMCPVGGIFNRRLAGLSFSDRMCLRVMARHASSNRVQALTYNEYIVVLVRNTVL